MDFFVIIISGDEMESLSKEKIEELHSIGKDFAFDGMDPSQFKGHNDAEKKAFLEGYKEGLQLMKESQEELETGRKMVA